MKKISLGLATALTTLSIAPSVFAAPAANLGTVASLPAGGCSGPVNATVTGELNSASVKLSYNAEALCLKYQPQVGSGETPQGHKAGSAWVGFSIEAKDSETAQKAKFYRPDKSEGEFENAIDSGYTASFWVGFDEEKLQAETSKGHESMSYTYIFDWDGDPKTTDDRQTVELEVSTTTLTLQNEKGEETFTPKDAEININNYLKEQEEANKPTETPETPAETTEDTTNPNTADPVALYATIAALSLAGLGATAVIAKKTRR